MQTETYDDPMMTELEPPTQFDVRVADMLAPLQTALSQAALDRANAQAELRAWQAHAAAQAEQIAALKARVAAMMTSTALPLERRVDAENGASTHAPGMAWARE